MIGVGSGSNPARGRRPSAARVSEREAWIALSTRPGIGPAGFARLVLEHGSAIAAWKAWHAHRAANHDAPTDPRAIARGLVETTAAADGRIVTALDDEYPPALRTLDPRPPTLFVNGSLEVFRRRAVAIVGTRGASSYGLSVATEIAHDLATSGVAVVSGLALGIDGAAHRASVAARVPGVAVLPSPLDRIYPPRHRALARDLLRHGGALVSEIPAGIAIGKPDFARRNRIIAGLAEAVVVVEAPDRSGALLTAAAAMAIGRELYAVPGPIDAMASRGCNRLIADHQAELVTSSAWLLGRIGLATGRRPPSVGSLSEVEGLVLRALLERPGSIEELVDRARQPAASVASALTMLESRGLVDSYGGATFHTTLAAKRLAEPV
ncbi:MAG: DNA-processing protein DprA [Chloroflexi bacterium]|nr:DNA-processing protein DprA [Chloroflexota bacterium]